MSLTFLWAVPYAYFQGLLQYKLFTFFVVISSFLRFAFPVVFMLSNKHLSNVFLAMSLGTCLTILMSLIFLKRDFIGTKNPAVWKELLFIIKFSLPVMVTNLCLMAFNNNDLILVRRFFSPEDSGFYAGTQTLGKILLFGTSAVATVMFPKISNLKSKNEDIKPMFYLFLKIQSALIGCGLVVFTVFPKLIATIFFGTKFLDSVKYLPLFAVFVGLYVMLNFLILFLFAVDITSLSYALFFLVIAQTAIISSYHSSIFQVITVNIIIISSALAVAWLYSYKFLKKYRS
jgi:O-antigen/teichoic acid export membrane protein